LRANHSTSLLFALIFSIAFVGIAIARQSPKSEQAEFAAGEPIHVPVQIPAIAVRALSADSIVLSCLKSKGIPPETLSAQWFRASSIHLHRANETDMVVMPAMSGDSTESEKSRSGCWDLVKYKGSDKYEGSPFWVLRNTGRGYEMALSVHASTLTIRSTWSRGFRTVVVMETGTDSVGFDYMEFNGSRYISKEYKLPD